MISNNFSLLQTPVYYIPVFNSQLHPARDILIKMCPDAYVYGSKMVVMDTKRLIASCIEVGKERSYVCITFIAISRNSKDPGGSGASAYSKHSLISLSVTLQM